MHLHDQHAHSSLTNTGWPSVRLILTSHMTESVIVLLLTELIAHLQQHVQLLAAEVWRD